MTVLLEDLIQFIRCRNQKQIVRFLLRLYTNDCLNEQTLKTLYGLAFSIKRFFDGDKLLSFHNLQKKIIIVNFCF